MKLFFIILFLFFYQMSFQEIKQDLTNISNDVNEPQQARQEEEYSDELTELDQQKYSDEFNKQIEQTEILNIIRSAYDVVQTRFEECLDNISDYTYTIPNIKSCIGQGYSQVRNSFFYIRQQLIQTQITNLKQEIYDICNNDDFDFSSEGQLFQNKSINQRDETIRIYCQKVIDDMNQMINLGLNFGDTINLNKQLYTHSDNGLPSSIFQKIVDSLQSHYKYLNDLEDDLQSNETIILSNLDQYIHQRTILETHENNQPILIPISRKYKINVHSYVTNVKRKGIDLDNLPSYIPLDASPKLFDGSKPKSYKQEDMYGEAGDLLRKSSVIVNLPKEQLID